jgi:hypothetical protein
VEIEGSAYADQRYIREAEAVIVHPLLLLRCADADKDDVSIRSENPGLNLFVFDIR